MTSLAGKLAIYFSIAALATPAFSQSFEAWSAKAQKAQKAGDDAVAAEYWTNALRAWESKDGKSHRAKALSERAALYEKAGEQDGALADLSAAIKLDPKSASLYDRRGQLYLAQSKLTEAISDFYSATKRAISYGPAYYHRALAYEQQGDAGFAKEDYRTACKLGVKDACARAKGKKPAPKAAEKPAAEKAAPAEKPAPEEKPQSAAPPAAAPKAGAKKKKKEPAKPQEPKTLGKTVSRGEAKPVPKADMDACVAALQACNDDGVAIDQCVKQAKTCETSPGKGCCPESCVREFQRQGNTDRSDADLFRNVFTTDAPCAKGTP